MHKKIVIIYFIFNFICLIYQPYVYAAKSPTLVIASPTQSSSVNNIAPIKVIYSKHCKVLQLYIDGQLYLTKRIKKFSKKGEYVFNWNTDGFAEGVHSIQIYGYYLSKNSDDEKYKLISSSIIEVTLDNSLPDIVIPDIEITGVGDNSYYNEDITPIIEVTDENLASYNITLNGNSFSSGTPVIEEGEYTLTINAVDSEGNEANKSISFTIDKTAPQIIIESCKDNDVFIDNEIVLQGQVDEEVFSENITLSNIGYNAVRKEAQDLAGNTNSVEIGLYYYPGSYVSSEGSTICSTDESVELSIPEDALQETSVIYVDSVDGQALEGSVSEDVELLVAVDCKPDGTVFSKPVQLSIQLEQDETPGTLVELGLYDEETGEIVSTGQTAVVQSDSRTVIFSISHFSTYAVLKNLVSQGAPIGTGVEIPLPDMLTGAFSHSVPITIPPARGGMQPGLSLTYKSSNPNSWTGIGFNLNPGYIVRSTRNGTPSYNDEEDRFFMITSQGALELTHVSDNLYMARIESDFTKFFKESDDTWRVLSKDGTVLMLGVTSNSKEYGSLGTYSWYVTKAIDTNGNYMTYSYTQDEGKSYLSTIEYAGNDNTGSLPKHSVEFILEARDDVLSSYISGEKIKTAKRLKEIYVKIEQSLVWNYVLDYSYSSASSQSFLNKISKYADDGTPFPAQEFKYKE